MVTKKAESTKVILEKMTESQIKTWGGNRFARKKWKSWTITFILAVGFGFIFDTFMKPTVMGNIISILPLLIVFVAFFYSMSKAGKKFWEEIKDKPEPIEVK